MGNLGKKLLGIGLLSATAGAAVYYLQKRKKKTLIFRKNSQTFRII